MRKGKLTMIISIGCTALILTMIMFTQFKTVEETDITAIETMRETELREKLSDLKLKYEEIKNEVIKLYGNDFKKSSLFANKLTWKKNDEEISLNYEDKILYIKYFSHILHCRM